MHSGPPFLIFLHPALGPFWDIIRQKVCYYMHLIGKHDIGIFLLPIITLLDNLFYLRYGFELQLAKQDSEGQSYFPL